MAQRQPDHQGLANQGTLLGSSASGTKHTSDPERYENPTTERAGAVASDSLAAESTRAGGAFAQNRDPEPLSVSGSSSTFNNTDISGATTLAPAPDAAEREAKEAWSQVPEGARGHAGAKYPEGAGTASFPGAHTAEGYAGGPTSAKESVSSTGYQSSGSRTGTAADAQQGGSRRSDNEAPGYAAGVKSEPAQTGKPKGKNITEGGFDDDPSKNASFTSDIGDKNDPGRLAEQQFQTSTQTSAGGKGPRQHDITGDGQYSVLDTDQNL
ncbi:MAG: hypothetical protein LQ342_001954 [Letrouitia transgressa]|nr:MAG: hypothetical protein LQ342_001954 [Letrouitia transgressa]